ncbi:MAG: hypothetical protein HKN45_08895 [Flavobacteriales bacterium]|nr:hypothetical protein [Flavobacteriales bacterium]
MAIPHVHDIHISEQSTYSQEESSELMDWLNLFFDHDLGDGHLETFELARTNLDLVNSSDPVGHDLLPFFNDCPCPLHSLENSSNLPKAAHPGIERDSPISSRYGLRAPPIKLC